MKCKYVKKQIVKYIDGEISSEELNLCKKHISSCLSCRKFEKEVLFEDNYMSNIISPKSDKTFSDFEKLITDKRKISFIPTWEIAAAILFAAILGATIGFYNKIDFNEQSYAQYTYNNISYVSMLEDIK